MAMSIILPYKLFQDELLSLASQVLVGRCHSNRILVSWL